MRCNRLNAILVILTFRFSNLLIALFCIPALAGVSVAHADTSLLSISASPSINATNLAKSDIVDLTNAATKAGKIPQKIQSQLKAAGRGDVLAMYDIAQFLYEQTPDQGIDYRHHAFSWALSAARRGHGEAALLTGQMYRNGFGVQQNFIRARKWLERARSRRASEPNFELALLYADANNPSRDPVKADAYISAAITASEPRGCLVSAKDKMNDGASFKDVIREINCAANGGIIDAMEMLGDYHLAQRSPLAVARARAWFRKATALGSQSAAQKLNKLAVAP